MVVIDDTEFSAKSAVPARGDPDGGRAVDPWQQLIGREVVFVSRGRGVIIEIQGRGNRLCPLIKVRFESSAQSTNDRCFLPSQLADGSWFPDLDLPQHLSELLSHPMSVPAPPRVRDAPSRIGGGIAVAVAAPKSALQLVSDATSGRMQVATRDNKDLRPVRSTTLGPTEVARRDAIRRTCEKHQLRAVFHFTRLSNLESILQVGILSRAALERLSPSAQPQYNDGLRLDGQKDAVCLSIGYPNYRLFYRYRQQTSDEWVVLRLAVSMLWKLDCAFCTENAASRAVTSVPISQRRAASALEAMFADNQSIRRADLGIPCCYPTNPQAEVLAFETVRPEFIEEVYFEHRKAPQTWAGAREGALATPTLTADEYHFRGRQDWLSWSSSSCDPATAESDWME